ncbi:MAG: DUF2281 domain-containing protein [Chloracidobacterium sp.]|nr:DUF2281 domain-containing protein [Chloracidobacterium sp.]
MLTAIERTGTTNANSQIVLDEDLPENAPARVRVIVLYDENGKNGPSTLRRKAGSAEGQLTIPADFDEPLEDLEEYQP